MEWANATKYNSFNSYKGLTYYGNYNQIMRWMREETDYLIPPVECNLDPVAECNLDCYFCITQRYLRTHREEVGKMRMLPTKYMIKLVNFLAHWGVRGLCISGGGEPTIHKGLAEVILHAKDKMDVAVVTNATLITDELAEALMECRWVALSIDSADKETYKTIKGVDLFSKIIYNIAKLVYFKKKTNLPVDLCFKFLVLPENQNQIYKACQLAKELGVQDFHARPVDFERNDIKGHKQLSINMKEVEGQFTKCHELESSKFKVYTVMHKFDSKFHVKHDFEKCLASPLVIPILQDGNAYLCVDKKMERKFKLGYCYPDSSKILSWWSSNKHRKAIKNVDVAQCSRCTWSQYNRQIEEVIIKDGMCLSFP
tara:strand:+ start:261 stop:1370 length:1110 start_codon:yes stop_codon:yes gene_type:complete